MAYYHCSPVAGLRVLEPRTPASFAKPRGVYLTTSEPMALMYGVRNFEYSYGYTKDGRIYYDEYFPNALRLLYKGQSASLYLCAPGCVHTTAIPNEAVCDTPVAIVRETHIPDVYEALLEQEARGALIIHRYETLPPEMLDWVRRTEADEIRSRNLMHRPGPMAEYYRRHYPESWALAEAEESTRAFSDLRTPSLPLTSLDNPQAAPYNCNGGDCHEQ